MNDAEVIILCHFSVTKNNFKSANFDAECLEDGFLQRMQSTGWISTIAGRKLYQAEWWPCSCLIKKKKIKRDRQGAR